MIKYRTRWDDEIAPYEVVKETAKQVTYLAEEWNGKKPERREAKESGYHSWHDTWEDAHAYLLAKAEKRLEGARYQLQQAQGHYGNIKGMKKP